MTHSVIATDFIDQNLLHEKRIFEEAGVNFTIEDCQSPQAVIEKCRDADALLVQWAPMTREVFQSLSKCKIVLRCGIGIDNVDVEAAREFGVPVCNVPDYGVDEVADHALSLALALGRQLPQIDKRLRGGMWKSEPDVPMPAYREMTFATAGFGRIGRAVLERARGFKFRTAAYDPFVPADAMRELGVEPLSLDELFEQADILSLHLPFMPETKHVVNAQRLARMKPTAIVVNTARGGLIDTKALAQALENKVIASAGLDVYETEPLETDHPILSAPNALLTSHVAWYSEASVPRLHTLASEEILRALRGEPLRSQVGA